MTYSHSPPITQVHLCSAFKWPVFSLIAVSSDLVRQKPNQLRDRRTLWHGAVTPDTLTPALMLSAVAAVVSLVVVAVEWSRDKKPRCQVRTRCYHNVLPSLCMLFLHLTVVILIGLCLQTPTTASVLCCTLAHLSLVTQQLWNFPLSFSRLNKL